MKNYLRTGLSLGLAAALTIVTSLGVGCSEGGKGGKSAHKQSSMSTPTDQENPPAPPGDRVVTKSTSGAPRTPSPVSPEDAARAGELLRQAQAAFVSNQYLPAIKRAEESIRLRPTTRAWAVLGSAACKARDVEKARLAHQSLRGGSRHVLIQICKQAGVDLP